MFVPVAEKCPAGAVVLPGAVAQQLDDAVHLCHHLDHPLEPIFHGVKPFVDPPAYVTAIQVFHLPVEVLPDDGRRWPRSLRQPAYHRAGTRESTRT